MQVLSCACPAACSRGDAARGGALPGAPAAPHSQSSAGYVKALEDALKVVDELAFPIDTNDREQMLKIIASCIGTKFTSRFGTLMPVSAGSKALRAAASRALVALEMQLLTLPCELHVCWPVILACDGQ